MAFIAHDLRNVANDLDLMLDNARKHLHKPEFQRDLVLSMGDSVERMKGLLDRLSGSADRSVRIWRTLTRDLAGDVYVESCLAEDGDLSAEEWALLPVDEEGYRDLRQTFARIREVPGC